MASKNHEKSKNLTLISLKTNFFLNFSYVAYLGNTDSILMGGEFYT
jgi:hypothetical protein